MAIGLSFGGKSNNSGANGSTGNENSNLVPGSTNIKVSLNNIGIISIQGGRSLFGGCDNLKNINRTDFENSVYSFFEKRNN